MLIKLNDKWFKVEETFFHDGTLHHTNHTTIPMLKLEDGQELYVAKDSDAAGAICRQYYKNMAENDPKEFTCHVSSATLIAWGLGQWSGAPGCNQYRSLDEWLDGVAEEPEQHFGCDGYEIDVDDWSEALQTELGFDPGVVYLHNGSL